jgi:SET domain-containing protein
MPVSSTGLVEVKWIPGKGRGVFATEFIKKGTLIERVPVLVVPAKEILFDEIDTTLSHYVFEWGRDTVAVALGYGSLYNHSYKPNARYDDMGRQTKSYFAVRNIEPGEEVTINYNGKVDAADPVWFDVIEDAPTQRKTHRPHKVSGPTTVASRKSRRR